MNKLELIDKLALTENLKKNEARAFIKLFFDILEKSIINEDDIEIRGFCSFGIKKHKKCSKINSKTSIKSSLQQQKKIHFKCGSNLKKIISQYK